LKTTAIADFRLNPEDRLIFQSAINNHQSFVYAELEAIARRGPAQRRDGFLRLRRAGGA
jgi:hypothetical protein